MEYASTTRSADHATSAIARAPAHIRAAINRTRATRGLPMVLSTRDYHKLAEARVAAEATAQVAEARRSGVWLSGRRGSPVPATGTKPAGSSLRSNTTAKGQRVCRVLLMPAYGEAAARSVRGDLPECIAHKAFGTADDLNLDKGWRLLDGHNGPALAAAGEQLRAIDTPAGLVVEWLPDIRLPWNMDAVRRIEAGENSVSVCMRIADRRTVRIPRPATFITRARLEHIALLRGDVNPAYPAARARVFWGSHRGDEAELRKQIDAVIECSRWYSRRAERHR